MKTRELNNGKIQKVFVVDSTGRRTELKKSYTDPNKILNKKPKGFFK